MRPGEGLRPGLVLACAPAGYGTTVRPAGRGSDPADPDRDLYENGGLLPGPDATLAGPTFEEWLDAAS